MSTLLRFSTPRKTRRATLLLGWLSGGSIVLYDGTLPASADEAISDQTPMVALGPLPDPAGTAEHGVFTLGAGFSATILASGTPDFARAFDSAGSVIGDFDVGETGSGAAIILDNINLIAGALVTLVSLVVAEH